MANASDTTGNLDTALANTRKLIVARPALAEEQAREILKHAPGHPEAELLLALARARQGDHDSAFVILERLARTQPKAPAVHYTYAQALAHRGDIEGAIAALRHAAALKPDHAEVWRALGDALMLKGDTLAADDAYARHIKASVNDPRLIEAASALVDNRLAVAETLLREFLTLNPTDVTAMRMLAEVGVRVGQLADAEALLARTLELAPSFDAARHLYAIVLHREQKSADALREIEPLVTRDPRNANYLSLKGAALARTGDQEKAAQVYEALLAGHPKSPKAWMSFGHTQKTLGKLDASVTAYRKSIELMPQLGEAWWSLANLKTVRFTPGDIAAMRSELARTDLAVADRFHLHFALAKALEDEGKYSESWDHYEKANALRRGEIEYDADGTHARIQRAIGFFTRDFFEARKGWGDPSPDPIFIVGLPRSGSTLLEQILSSHSAVEGTQELSDIITMSRRLGGRKRKADTSVYPDVLASAGRDAISALGAEYLSRTRMYRKTDKPFFIDKMPNNFLHTGFIHLILPNAKIIDARRDPMACCFSNFKQHFASGQNFSYSLSDLGRFYGDYVALMQNFDTVLPGRVHRVMYEDVVADPEREIRRLLVYCGLPFEEGCLRFYESDRAVRTPSSEQVRQPIYSSGLDQWRHYEQWLGPLKSALTAQGL